MNETDRQERGTSQEVNTGESAIFNSTDLLQIYRTYIHCLVRVTLSSIQHTCTTMIIVLFILILGTCVVVGQEIAVGGAEACESVTLWGL